MVCLGLSSNGCQAGHPSALDYFLAVLIMFVAVFAARLLVCAVARCLCDDDGAAAHHHHHHHHQDSPDTTDVDEGAEPWGGGAGLPILGQPGLEEVPPPRWRSLPAVAAGTEHVGHVAHPTPAAQPTASRLVGCGPFAP